MVRKELDPDMSEWERTNERTLLEALRTLKHPNILELLASYTHDTITNLLFPQAEMDLHKFFASAESVTTSRNLLYSGMYGLSDALRCIHNFSFKDSSTDFSAVGFHHDLKPKNILMRGGIFMISDFGVARLKPAGETSKTYSTGRADDYTGPEVFDHIDLSKGRVGRALDIWSFGCILAEFVTFIERGHGSVGEFRKARTIQRARPPPSKITFSTTCFRDLNGLNPFVDTWLTALATDPKFSQTPPTISLIRRMLKPIPEDRIDSATVASELLILSLFEKTTDIGGLYARLEQGPQGRLQPYLFLEKARFEAWGRSYRMSNFDPPDLISKCQHLDEIQRHLLSMDLCWSSEDSTAAPCLNDALEKASQLVDQLRKELPVREMKEMDRIFEWDVIGNEKLKRDNLVSISAMSRYRMIQIKAAMHHICTCIAKSRRAGQTSQLIEDASVDLDGGGYGNEGRSVGTYTMDNEEIRVIVEWKAYDTRWRNGPEGEELLARAESLATLLDRRETKQSGVFTDDRLLDCLGFLHNTATYRIGFVYSFPPSTSRSTGPVSLNSHIRQSLNGESSRPDLGDLFRLAQALVTTVGALHEAGWLHKNISSHNIVCFPPTDAEAYRYIGSGYLVGFSHSRPGDALFSQGLNDEGQLYQHPTYREASIGYDECYDYFSVGIVLLEIALWSPISDIWENHRGEDLNAEGFRKLLVKYYAPQAGPNMGALYQAAVLFCLQASHAKDPSHTMDVRRAFRKEVVEKLEKCFA